MSKITVQFLEKEYNIPQDVITYIDLVDFTNNVKITLMTAFKKQISHSIDVIEDDDFMVSVIKEQVSRFLQKLLEHDVYDKTVKDYLNNNKGYTLFLDTKNKIVRQIVSIRQEKLDVYRAGVEDAIYKKEASVTGLDFGIISGSFVNHMIYSYMDASKEVEQEKKAIQTYHQDIAELDKRVAAFDKHENTYISENVIPAMDTVFTFLAYELLDKYVADLIEVKKFDSEALKYIDLERSNDLLDNLALASNKYAVIERAFVACPFNVNVYIQALNNDLLDLESFKTSEIFKQSKRVLHYLDISINEAVYPSDFELNYKAAEMLALYLEGNAIDFLKVKTEYYATSIVKEYSKLQDKLNSHECGHKEIYSLEKHVVLAGEEISKRLAFSEVDNIVNSNVWNTITIQCGHADLLDRIRDIISDSSNINSKLELDGYFKQRLFEKYEFARKQRVKEIENENRIQEENRIQTEKKTKEIKEKTIKVVGISAKVVLFIAMLMELLDAAVFTTELHLLFPGAGYAFVGYLLLFISLNKYYSIGKLSMKVLIGANVLYGIGMTLLASSQNLFVLALYLIDAVVWFAILHSYDNKSIKVFDNHKFLYLVLPAVRPIVLWVVTDDVSVIVLFIWGAIAMSLVGYLYVWSNFELDKQDIDNKYIRKEKLIKVLAWILIGITSVLSVIILLKYFGVNIV